MPCWIQAHPRLQLNSSLIIGPPARRPHHLANLQWLKVGLRRPSLAMSRCQRMTLTMLRRHPIKALSATSQISEESLNNIRNLKTREAGETREEKHGVEIGVSTPLPKCRSVYRSPPPWERDPATSATFMSRIIMFRYASQPHRGTLSSPSYAATSNCRKMGSDIGEVGTH